MVPYCRVIQLYTKKSKQINREEKKMFKTACASGFDNILKQLPTVICSAVGELKKSGKFSGLSEIRLRAGMYQSLTVNGENLIISDDGKLGKNVLSPLILDEKAIGDIVFKMCSGSVYSHAEELKKGYISQSGIRIGVCGKGLVKDGDPSGFLKYNSLNIRLPHHVASAADELLRYIDKNGIEKVGGILVVSPPGYGKTTFLRALASRLSGGFYSLGKFMASRVCIVDEREEIYLPEAFEKGFCDVISALPKAYSIEICTRVMAPDYIVCDEIGSDEEAEAICASATRGITFAATCHGNGIEDVSLKKGIRSLFERKIFNTVCELSLNGREHTCIIKNAEREGSIRIC